MEKKTGYQISSSVNERIFEIIPKGEFVESDAEKITNELTSIIKENGIKNVLINNYALKGRLGFFKTYQCVRNYHPDICKIRFAMVDIPENAVFQSFLEATGLNAGMNLKWFTDIDKARTWLKSK